MTPDRYRPVDTDEVLRRVDTHARVGAALLGGLGEVGREGDDEAFTSELVTAARNAGTHELADEAYDLARACLDVHGQYSRNLIWVEPPRSKEQLHESILQLHDLVRPNAPRPDLASPGDESDLRPVMEALRLCEELEGRSERVLFLLAEAPAVHDQWDVVAERAAALAAEAEVDTWRRCARLLQTYALIRKEDGATALGILNSLKSEYGVDRVLLSNLCCAYALLGDSAAFHRTARAFADCDRDASDAYDWPASMRSSLGWFSERLQEPTHLIAASFGLEQD